MAQAAEFAIGATASCPDGVRGKVSRMTVDPAARPVTHPVIEPTHRREPGRLALSTWSTPRPAMRRRATRGVGGGVTTFTQGEKRRPEMPSTRGRIVVGVDGTTASAAAVRWAAREGRLRRASVHLLYVHDSDQSGRAPYARILISTYWFSGIPLVACASSSSW
jgi:Universal stress protein family